MRVDVCFLDYTSLDEKKTAQPKACLTQYREEENGSVKGLNLPRLLGMMRANSCLRFEIRFMWATKSDEVSKPNIKKHFPVL